MKDPRKATEEQIQKAIIDRLRLMRFQVFSTSRIRRKCQKCGGFPGGGDGVDKGLPDLFFRDPSWPAGVWGGIEVKGPGTAISREQAELSKAHAYPIVRDQDHAAQYAEALSRFVRAAGWGSAPMTMNLALLRVIGAGWPVENHG